MSKGFLLAVAAIGGIFYFLTQSDPASKGGSGAGEGIIEISPANYDLLVGNNSEPVLAYFWAEW